MKASPKKRHTLKFFISFLGSKDEQTAPQLPRPKRKDSQKRKKRETGHYLTYYQSAIADGRAEDNSDSDKSRFLVRQASTEDSASSSSSDYSSEDSRTTSSKATGLSTTTHYLYPDVNPSAAGTRLRAAVPSNGGADRRRMAIVEMDAASGQSSPEIPTSKQSEETSSIRSRRGVKPSLAGLALVAPPDAAPNTYAHLTPPTTGPHTAVSITGNAPLKSQDSPRVLQKKRSTREHQGTPRGRNVASPKSKGHRVMLSNNEHTTPRLNYPISPRSQSPSRSPSPSKSASDRPGPNHARRYEQVGSSLLPQQRGHHGVATPKSSRQPLQLTPEIGQYKEIGTRVAAPVVISLDSAAPLRRKDNSNSNHRKSSPPGVRSASSVNFPSSSRDRPPMPGLHNTAGPPPPPPRAVFNIDATMPAPPRPPRLHSPNPPRTRDIESIKQALQLPPSVTAALAAKTPKTSPNASPTKPPNPIPVEVDSEKSLSSHTSLLNHSKSIHRREGAFSPSRSNTSTEDTDALQTKTPTKATLPQTDSSRSTTSVTEADRISVQLSAADDESGDSVPPMTSMRPLRFSDEQSQTPLKKDGELTDVTNDSELTPSRKRRTYHGSGSSSEYSNSSTSPSRRSSRHGRSNSTMTDLSSNKTPSPPPKTGLNRNSLSLSIKRFSALPRTPSSASSKSVRRTSTSTHYSSRTPSPSLQSIAPPALPDRHPPFKKIKSQHPPAMFCAEIFARKTSMERCLLYAQKINELYVHDSGLSDWTFETKIRTTTNRPSTGPASLGPQPRHASRGSIVSEATFPIRSDAYTATDLSTKADDIAPASPINLPYPSLAHQNLQPPRSTTSVGSGTPPSSIRSYASSSPSIKSGGFFSSIGRKVSMSAGKQDKPILTPTTPNSSVAKLTKSPPTPLTRPINIPAAPAIPGGPRAIPGSRPMRSQTLMIHTSSPNEREGVARRPSLADVSHSPVLDISPDPSFVRQVDKLADLLPHAERDVLAGYLRRAGQDILAIGQYLEDEKNGTIRPY